MEALPASVPFLQGSEKALKQQLMAGQFIRIRRLKSDCVLEIALGWERADMNSSLSCGPISQEF